MNAIDFLIKDHNKVRAMLSEISDNSHRYETKRKMFEALSEDLIRHETMEHKTWYPHFKNDIRLREEVKHLLKEENNAEKAIKQFEGITNQQAWEEKFIKFRKDVEHHAQEEEHELFPEVKKLLDNIELTMIGKKMQEFKAQYRHH